MIVIAYLSMGGDLKPIHREHLVEQIGLLSIILLSEAVIGLVGSLSRLEWNQCNLVDLFRRFSPARTR